MVNRYIVLTFAVAMTSGCTGLMDSAIDFETDEPARRIVTDILRSNDFVARGGLIKQHVASVESEPLSFCNNDVEDRTIKVRIFSEFGSDIVSGRELYFCVTGHGDIRKLGEQAVDMVRPEKLITWSDLGSEP